MISLSFANIKEKDYDSAKTRICQVITDLYNENAFLLEKEHLLTEQEQLFFKSVCAEMPEVTAAIALHRLSSYLHRYYGKKVIILLDEYDTPMQEAYVDGYWDRLCRIYKKPVQRHVQDEPVAGARYYDRHYPGKQGVDLFGSE